MIRLLHGDCRDVLRTLSGEESQFHSCVTDPPYHLTSIAKRFGKAGSAPAQFGTDGAYARASRGFMGKEWDGGAIAFQPETWRAVYDVLLPGAHLLAFGGTRTYHRLVCAIEDAGFEIRDATGWLFGSGFPKSHDVSKAIDKAAGHLTARGKGFNAAGIGESNGGSKYRSDHPEYTAYEPATPEAAAWQGWGTALKPAMELICVARKPLIGSVAANVLAHGCGALNIDACRVSGDVPSVPQPAFNSPTGKIYGFKAGEGRNGKMSSAPTGRWPANIITDGSPEVEEAFAAFGEKTSNPGTYRNDSHRSDNVDVAPARRLGTVTSFGDSGSASRFFYSAKADKNDRAGSKHPTVKPTDLMRYLVQLVTPPGGTVLDPFAGSGSTGLAADQLGMNAVLVERDPEYAADIERKITGDCPLFASIV